MKHLVRGEVVLTPERIAALGVAAMYERCRGDRQPEVVFDDTTSEDLKMKILATFEIGDVLRVAFVGRDRGLVTLSLAKHYLPEHEGVRWLVVQ